MLLTVTDLALQEHGISVLHPLSFVQAAGQKLALAGASGAGKSTLLQLVGGLVQPSAGEVRVDGRRVRGPQEVLIPGHPGVAYLSQKSELPHSLRVEQVLRYANKRPTPEADALYALCHIEHLLARRTDQLSGGEQQRVALARLLLGSPQLLLLDEPFSNLDRGHKRVMQQIIEDVGQRLGVTCLLVSHDAADTLPWADELLVLERGRLVQQGSPARIYQQPASEYVAALFGDYSLVHGLTRRMLTPGRRLRNASALLVRPEQFVLHAPGQGVAGTVRAVRYFGSYHEVEVVLARDVVRVRTGPTSLGTGEAVGVTLVAGSGWEVG